jgi:hypothetical protein
MMLYILARDHWEKDLKERKYAARCRTDVALKSVVADNDDNDDGGGGGNDDDDDDDDDDIEEADGDGSMHINGSTTTMIINYKEATKQSHSYPYSTTVAAAAGGGGVGVGGVGGVLKARTTIDVEVEVIGNRSSGHIMSINGSRSGGCDDNDDDNDDNDIDDDDNDMVNDGRKSSSKQQVLNRSKKRKVSSRGMVNVVPKSRRKFLESKGYAGDSKGMIDDGDEDDEGDDDVDDHADNHEGLMMLIRMMISMSILYVCKSL